MSNENLVFYSTAALERGLDGGDDRYSDYIFALYRCRPDELAGSNERREELRKAYPTKVLQTGSHFVLVGEAAYLSLSSHYQALAACETLSEDYRAYANERLSQITSLHRESQSLLVPVDLTEGQLSQDRRLELLTCLAISNGQVRAREA
jgi:hypothetical protein